MTQEHQIRLGVGSKFELDGDQYVVESFTGTGVLARNGRGNLLLYHLGSLFNGPGFKLVDVEPSNSEAPLEGVPPSAVKAAKAMAEHMLEAITGYRSGSDEDPAPGEPRREYDPELFTLSQRLAHKAIELGKTERAMWLAKQALERYGLMGLVDKRSLRHKNLQIDARVRLKLIEVMAEFEDKANPSKLQLARRTRRLLKVAYPDTKIEFPSSSSFNRLVDLLDKGTQLFGDAKQRRSNANRPDEPYSHFFADRPGELVVIDSTPLNVFAMDPYSFKWVQVQLTIALDIYSRSLVAWRFTPVGTNRVDASFLLSDILRPKPMRASWQSSMKWASVGVPENILVELGGDPNKPLPLAALPFLHPDSVLVDRGRVFLSDTFMAACRTLGINFLVARPYTPTDKAHVERVFKTIEEFLRTLKGYKGRDIRNRGLDPESEAFWFIDEIDEKFGEWVGEYYQNNFHEGLELPYVPTLKISPNHMLQEGIVRAGFVIAPPDANLFYRLLPTVWRTIQHYGVEHDLRYDGDILNSFRNQKSPYEGKYAGKWPFKYDPRNRSVMYFMDPATLAWHPLYWTGAGRTVRPFSEKTLSYAKGLVLARHLDPKSERDMRQVLEDLLNRIEDRQVEGSKERRIAAMQMMQTANAAKDRSLAPPSDESPDSEEEHDFAAPSPRSEKERRIVQEATDAADEDADELDDEDDDEIPI
jgi:transposase InsO family protein